MHVQHLGALHPVEQALTLVLAFGPFLVLGAVAVVRRRREAREPQQPSGDLPSGDLPSGDPRPGDQPSGDPRPGDQPSGAQPPEDERDR